MNHELDKLHMTLAGAIIDFQKFPWPNRLGKRDEATIGCWLKSLRDRLQELDNKLYVAAKESSPPITLRDAAQVLSQNLDRVALMCGPCTYATTSVIYCQQDDGMIINGKLESASFAPREDG